MKFWRDADHHEYRLFGVVLWFSGGEVYIGHRLYRWRYYTR